MKKILILGANGQIGTALKEIFNEGIFFTHQELDITAFHTVQQTISQIKPEVIINTAAYTHVDNAEDEPEIALRVNGEAPGVLAEAAKECNALLIHYSTDYIFDGTKKYPYVENDPPNPLNVYGKSKLAGEKAIIEVGCQHLILRTSWVYSPMGRNFYTTMMNLAREKKELNIVNDQIGSPTYSTMIARATKVVIDKAVNDPSLLGVFNLTAYGETSWYDFAKMIFHLHEENSLKINAVSSDAYPSKAMRPSNSVLSNHKIEQTFGITLPHWKEQLTEMLQQDIVC